MQISKLLVTGMIAAIGAFPMQAEKVVILHTNDTHSQIDPTTDGYGGVLRRKALVDSVRNINDNVILIDAGDIVQGTLFFNIYKGEVEEKVMNAIGYDLRILGNHEFDNGMVLLADNLRNAEATLLAANYQMLGTPLEGLFAPYSIKEIGGKRIAFIPVNLQPEGMIAKSNYDGMGYVDAIEAANNMAWYLKNILQADMVVAITHIGYVSNANESDVKLVKSSHDIDIVIGGHSHTTIDPENPKSSEHIILNADGREVLVTQTGRYGKYVGEIEFDTDNLQAMPKYHLLTVDARYDDKIDPAFAEMLMPYRESVDLLNTNVVGKSAKELKREEAGLLNFTSDFVAYRGRQMADNVDFAIINKGGLRNSLPKGNITEGQLITMMPFFNRIMVMDISGRDLLDAFNVMAAQGGNGVSKEVNAVFSPTAKECIDIKIDGKDINLDRTYRIATIDYLANGGDYMVPLTNHQMIAISDQYLYEDLLDYFRNGPIKGKSINPSDTVRMKPIKE